MIYDLSQRRATMFERSLHPALVVHNIIAEVTLRCIQAASWIYTFARMAMLATFCINIFIADSASYNLKAIAWEQEFAKGRPYELTCKFMCAIHHLYRCRQPMLAWFDVIDPLFCLFRLWQIGSNKRHMRAHQEVREEPLAPACWAARRRGLEFLSVDDPNVQVCDHCRRWR